MHLTRGTHLPRNMNENKVLVSFWSPTFNLEACPYGKTCPLVRILWGGKATINSHLFLRGI